MQAVSGAGVSPNERYDACMAGNNEDGGDGFQRGDVQGRAFAQRSHGWVGLGEAVARKVGAERSTQTAHRLASANTADKVFALSNKDLEAARPLERVQLLSALMPIIQGGEEEQQQRAKARVRDIVASALPEDMDFVRMKLGRDGQESLLTQVNDALQALSTLADPK